MPMSFNEVPQEAAAWGIAIIIVVVLVSLASTILTAIVCCKISSKAGYNWALGLIMLVPVANVILLLILAFSEWPIQKELRAYKKS